MNFRGLDLNLLVAMDALLAEKSTTKAGERIHLSQSAVSGSLARLRQFFGDELLVQVGHKMVLTALAEELAGPVRDALQRVEAVVHKDATFDPETSERRFRIMLSDYAANVLMTSALPMLQQRAPGIGIELLSNSESPAQALEQSDVDLLLIAKQYSSTSQPSEELFSDDYTCIVWKDNKQCGESLTLEEFLRFGHVVARFGRGQQPSADEQFLLQVGVQRRVEVVVMSFAMLPQMVVNTTRIATVHSRLARLYAKWLPIRLIKPPVEIPRLVEVVNWHKIRDADRGLRWLRQQLREAAADDGSVAALSSVQNRNGSGKAS